MPSRLPLRTIALLGGALGALSASCTLIDWDYRVGSGFGGGASTSTGSHAQGGVGGDILPSGPIWPDSATATCTDETMVVPCPTPDAAKDHGQDGDHMTAVPTYQAAGTATAPTLLDSVTGLTWEADFTAIAAASVDWPTATAHCKDLAKQAYGGPTTWRLPAPRELATLMDAGRATSTFPKELDSLLDDAMKNTTRLWTSAVSTGSPTDAWTIPVITQSDGVAAIQQTIAAGGRAICVAGDMGFASPVLTPASGELTNDLSTGLTWQSTLSPMALTWSDALSYCNLLTIGGITGFRLPSVKEMLSIVDYAAVNPAIDLMAFPGTPPERFWTSTPFAADPKQAWYVDFAAGIASPELIGTTTQQVRCVH